MRTAPSLPPLLVVALIAALALGCSSDPEDPTVDPGLEHEGGGIEPGTAGPVGSGTAEYPAGPYGHDVGTTIQNFEFTGFRNPKASGYVADASTMETIAFADFYNPNSDPNKPVALLVNASARWCTVCQEEARRSVEHYAYWQPKGVEFLTAIFEDENAEPAQFSDIEYWSKRFELEYPVVLDPGLTLGVFFDRSASPFNMIIDTRTMEIVFTEEGLTDLGPDNPTFKQIVGE